MITLDQDKVILGEGDNVCYIWPCLRYYKTNDAVKVIDRTGTRYRLTPECTGLADLDAIVAFLSDANAALCAGGSYNPNDIVEDCVSAEMVYTIPEGQTVTYANLLADFEANGTFDDGSKGAVGINEIDFGNINKGGLSFTYNGNSKTDYAGQFHFGDGNDYNDISNDISITSNVGETTITYVVYKCN